ncbi:borealin-2 [Betta splendens]|uniref:Borealin-2 n=1 Tax=Betta splendens TaxID=158456 RepID=A0A6P7PG68_BETSP|nr:borealin-2 [Betta splendens]
MPTRRAKNEGSASAKAQLNRDRRRNWLALLVQQFEKEAQERMIELEDKLENMLSTVDKVFDVELMKLPPSLQNTLIGDLISEEEVSASDVSIAMKNESIRMQQPLRRATGRRAHSSDSPPVQSSAVQRSSSKTSKGNRKARALAGSSSAGNLRGSTAKVSQSRVSKASDLAAPVKPKLRSVVSAGDLHCSVAAASAAHITVTTGLGQTVSFSEENKDDINWDLLDDVALCHIKKLRNLMDHLSRQSRSQR